MPKPFTLPPPSCMLSPLRFLRTFAALYESKYRPLYEEAGIYYEHRLIDDMVAQVCVCVCACYVLMFVCLFRGALDERAHGAPDQEGGSGMCALSEHFVPPFIGARFRRRYLMCDAKTTLWVDV